MKNSKDYERSQASRQEKREFSSHIREASLGNIEATRKGIADVVAKFCKDLYSSKNDERKDKQSSEAGLENTCDHPDDDIENDEQDRSLNSPEKNSRFAIDSLQKWKSADSGGIKAEDIKGAGEKTYLWCMSSST